MVAIVAAIVGIILGWYRATKMGGKLSDKLLYAVVHGIAFFLIALVLTVIIGWTGWV